MAKHTLRYLSRADVETIAMPMATIIERLDWMFREKGAGRVEMPPKPGIHPQPDAFIHAMPAHIPGVSAAGLKWVAGYPQNQSRGLPYISGVLVLNDPDTGLPIAIMDCTWITAMRTGAATAVAARYLARPDSRTVGIVACGVQGRSNLEALATEFPLERAKAYDIRPEIARIFAVNMQTALGIEVEPVEHVREAVEGMDLVVTSGPILKQPRPSIEPGWLSPGAFACPLDFDSLWHGDAFRAADGVLTDDLGQFGYYHREGYFQDTPTPRADLGQVAAGLAPGRTDEHERLIAINLGLACEDMVTARWILDAAIERGLGTLLPL